MSNEIYVSTDVETDGPIPGPHSMLSFGSVAHRANGKVISSYSINLETLPGASGHPETMAWWAKNQDAYRCTRNRIVAPEKAMPDYVAWLKDLPGKPVFVGYPAGFDFLFIYWYLIKFAGESPFGFSALDIKSYAMAVLKTGFRETVKKNMPKEWFPTDLPHTHVALDDAVEQGALFINMLHHNLGQGPLPPEEPTTETGLPLDLERCARCGRSRAKRDPGRFWECIYCGHSHPL